jgi:carbon starvation protein
VKIGFFSAAADLAAKLANGALPAERIAIAPKLIFNQRLDGWLTVFFIVVVWTVILDMIRGCVRYRSGDRSASRGESPYVPTQLA